MANAITFIRNKPPHYAGEKIGTDRLTADRLITAGYAREHDLDAEARASAPKAEVVEPVKTPTVDPAKTPEGKGPDGKAPAVK